MMLAKDWCRLSETKVVSVMWNLTVGHNCIETRQVKKGPIIFSLFRRLWNLCGKMTLLSTLKLSSLEGHLNDNDYERPN
jgi:hypothetical protein